jgi:peptide/nickel transport system substrate-binding protein
MNVETPHLDNPQVRQAINYAIDVQSIVDAIYQGHGAVGATQLAESVFGHYAGVEPFGFDVERARELMAEAGAEDGFAVTLFANAERSDRVSIAQIVEQQLREINIDVTIQTLSWPETLVALESFEADMFLLGWTTVTGDADYGLFPLLHSSQHGSAGNFTQFANAEVDRLLEAGRNSIDADERLAYYRDVQLLLRELAPWVIMLQEYPSAFVNYSIVENFVVDPIGTHFLGNVNLR